MTSYNPDLYPTYEYVTNVGVYLNEEHTHGELVHCLLKPLNIIRYDDPTCAITSIGILCNSCGIESGIEFLHGLNAGQVVPIKFMGEFDPVIPREWLLNQPWKSNNNNNNNEYGDNNENQGK